MSTFEVTVEKLNILPHPNADRLELAQVGLYHSVVAKGAFQDGDLAVYIPEQAILPEELIEELGLVGKLAGGKSNRVKAVRLRGQFSQGIVARPSSLADMDYQAFLDSGEDLAQSLGITKWVPEVPASMSGLAKPSNDLIPWINIEDIKRYPDIFTDGEIISVTEKLHGSACIYTYRVEDGKSFMSSKGLSGRGLSLVEADTNLYWRVGRNYNLEGLAAQVAAQLADNITHVGIFGEVFGAGVQDLTYGASGKVEVPGYQVFDIAVRHPNGMIQWLDTDIVRASVETADTVFIEQGGSQLKMVPELYRGQYDTSALEQFAEGKETVSGQALHIREGVVVRPVTEAFSDCGDRKIGKWVSEAYLTRKGGTEFE